MSSPKAISQANALLSPPEHRGCFPEAAGGSLGPRWAQVGQGQVTQDCQCPQSLQQPTSSAIKRLLHTV